MTFNIEEIPDENGGRRWRVQMDVTHTLEQLENIAAGIEAGELVVDGQSYISLPLSEADKIPEDLKRRLRGYLQFYATMRMP